MRVTTTERTSQIVKGVTVAALVGALAAGAAVVMVLQGSGLERAEHEHGFPLPASAQDIQTAGNGSVPLFEWIALDRSATTAFETDPADVDPLVGRLGDLQPASRRPIFDPELIDAAWADAARADHAYLLEPAFSGGDFTIVYVFDVEEDTVGVVLHTDWN
ncbi:MAG: hypothetical protein AAGC53_20090 [Actinomycetota bacterium]